MTGAGVTQKCTSGTGTLRGLSRENGRLIAAASWLLGVVILLESDPAWAQITKVNTAETDRQVMGALALPRGDYLVVAKANAYLSTGGAVPGLSAIRIQCMLFDPAVPASADFSTCAPVGNVSWNDAHMTMQLPASITAAEGGQVQVACRADIPQVGIDAGASAWVWDVAISATRVASVTAD